MTQLEIRLLAYGLLALLLLGGSAYVSWDFTATHYRAVIAANRAAEDEAHIADQQRVIAAQAAQQAAAVAAEKQYEDLKASATTLGDELARSLREYATLRAVIVSSGSSSPSGTHAASAGTESDPGIAELAGQAATACEADAAELTALQSWASKVTYGR